MENTIAKKYEGRLCMRMIAPQLESPGIFQGALPHPIDIAFDNETKVNENLSTANSTASLLCGSRKLLCSGKFHANSFTR